MKLMRWKAVVPLAIFLGLLTIGWWLLLDTIVRKGVEAVGAEIVGARVDVEEADVRLREGAVTLRGLQVTNPDAPMTNLFEAEEIVAQVRVPPLLQKKIYVDTVAIRGVRFGTERATSGALERPSQTNAAVRRQVAAWADRVRSPSFSLDGLGGAVNVSAIRPDSLATPALARGITTGVDSVRGSWESALRALNPAPVIDSARAFVSRLEGASLRTLGPAGLVQTVRDGRSTIDELTTMQTSVASLERDVSDGLGSLRGLAGELAESRRSDIAYAMSLLQIPSIEAPDISPALFGDLALTRLRPVLSWLTLAQQYLPPGLDPRRRPGPKRARLAGTTVDYPARGGYPRFTLAFGEIDLEIEGDGAGAGAYQAQVRGLSTGPALYGEPLVLTAARTGGGAGPEAVQLSVMLDHVTENVRDSVALSLAGVPLPSVTLPALGARLDLGRGVTDLAFHRSGDSVSGRWFWRSSRVSWDRLSDPQARGVQGRVENLLWRTVSGIRDVEIELRFTGNMAGPRLAIRSNVGSAISNSLRRQLEGEISDARRQVLARVNGLVAQPMRDARSKLSALEDEVQSLVTQQRARIDAVKTELEARLGELTRMLPPGVRIPNPPGPPLPE
jgi:uncharacterized protein (TIGR03545 family)